MMVHAQYHHICRGKHPATDDITRQPKKYLHKSLWGSGALASAIMRWRRSGSLGRTTRILGQRILYLFWELKTHIKLPKEHICQLTKWRGVLPRLPKRHHRNMALASAPEPQRFLWSPADIQLLLLFHCSSILPHSPNRKLGRHDCL